MRLKYFPLSKVVFAVILAAFTASIAIAWSNLSEKSRHLRMVPTGLAVSRVVYAREESWGFGPGGNETGVIMFELPLGVAHNIQQQGITFLDQYVSAQVVVRRGSSSQIPFNWKATSVHVEGADDDGNSTLTYDIGKYLNRYGFGLLIDKDVARSINDALYNYGNFVDDDGRRLVIIMPKDGKLVFV